MGAPAEARLEVSSQDLPVPEAGLESGTSSRANGHRFDYTLKPGEAFSLYLDRVNMAESGWEYRERRDFRHYPMSSPGEYALSAAGRFFHAGPAITSRPFRVWVE